MQVVRMSIPNIVTGQSIEESKKITSKKLRHEQTPAEAVLWNAVRRNQIDGFHFRRQQIIHGLIADFYCHSASLVVELDGTSHDQKHEADQERDQYFQSLGIEVLRLQNQDVFQQLEFVIETIRTKCRERTNSPNPLTPFPEGKGE
jgi:very-short-patch-repair endonuclease